MRANAIAHIHEFNFWFNRSDGVASLEKHMLELTIRQVSRHSLLTQHKFCKKNIINCRVFWATVRTWIIQVPIWEKQKILLDQCMNWFLNTFSPVHSEVEINSGDHFGEWVWNFVAKAKMTNASRFANKTKRIHSEFIADTDSVITITIINDHGIFVCVWCGALSYGGKQFIYWYKYDKLSVWRMRTLNKWTHSYVYGIV